MPQSFGVRVQVKKSLPVRQGNGPVKYIDKLPGETDAQTLSRLQKTASPVLQDSLVGNVLADGGQWLPFGSPIFVVVDLPSTGSNSSGSGPAQDGSWQLGDGPTV